MIEATSCGGVVIFRGKVLLLYKSYKNKYDGWVLPKGTVEFGETHEETALREVLEETGIEYEVDRLAFIHENFFAGDGTLEGKECHEIAFYFLMKPRGTQELNSNSYTQGVKENMYWLPIDKLNQYRAYPTFFEEKLKNIKNEIEHIITYE